MQTEITLGNMRYVYTIDGCWGNQISMHAYDASGKLTDIITGYFIGASSRWPYMPRPIKNDRLRLLREEGNHSAADALYLRGEKVTRFNRYDSDVEVGR